MKRDEPMKIGDKIKCAFDNSKVELIVGEEGDCFLIEGVIGGWDKDKNDKKIRKLKKSYLDECYYVFEKKEAINVYNNQKFDDFNNPYCESCGACGEADCCSPFMCLRKSVSKNKDCEYGETYLKEIKLYYELGKKLYDLILEKGNIENVKIVNKIYNDLFDEIYENQ